MSDERDGAGSTSSGTDPGAGSEEISGIGSRTAVVTRPQRPTGKRSRRGAGSDAVGELDSNTETAADGDTTVAKNGAGAKAKTARKGAGGPSRNPVAFIWNYLTEVVAELRKVIWPNRKQMVSYTAVVLVFLALMVTLIGFVDLGLAKLVMLVFG